MHLPCCDETMPLPFYTIGHSTRSLEEFVGILTATDVTNLVDVRTVPRSRTNPQFNQAVLPEALAAFDISYMHSADLGGLRGKNKKIPQDLNGFWTNDSFHNYADYALTLPFHEALTKLIEVGHLRVSAIMCAEAVWWRCHRRIIADYLIAQDKIVFHLMGEGRAETAKLTPGAIIRPDKTVIYPRND